MLSLPLRRIRNARARSPDLFMVACLVGLDVVARLLPHPPDFTPLAATGLFAASVLRARAMAVLVPILGMLLGDALLGCYDPKVMTAVYAALALPACAACWSSRLHGPRLIVPMLLSSSLLFFFVTNFAVWAFSGMYPANMAGLLKCYIAALPFLRNMMAGDLFFGLILFGGHWLAQKLNADKLGKLALTTIALQARL